MSAHIVTLVPGLAPAAPVMRVLSRFDRRQLEAFAEITIALLDLQDGDPDAEVTAAEDDFHTLMGEGPGCEISDPGGQMTEDEISAYPLCVYGPGCPISDPAEEEVAL